MYEECNGVEIKAFSFDCMITLQKMSKMKSNGRLINWENVWRTYPFNIIDLTSVFEEKENITNR